MYEIIEKNQYGVLVKNTTNYGDCFFCKYEITQCNNRYKCIINTYYLPDSEVERLESEKPTINGTTPDVVNLNSDTQKELIELRVELRVEKEKSKALEEYSRGLELNVKELEGTIENNVTELIHRTGDLTHDFWYFCAECLENFEMDENFNYCPNCGRKIVR